MRFFANPATSLLTCLILILLLTQPIIAVAMPATQNQSTVKANVNEQGSTQTPQQRALALLDQLLSQAKESVDQVKDYSRSGKFLKLALFQTEAANLLWDYDQPRARTLFEIALKSAAAQLPKVTGGKPLPTFSTETYSALCKEIVDFALLHDVGLAERLVSLALVPLQTNEAKDAAPNWAFLSQQAAFYSQIARHIAASDPQHAAELIRLSFNGYYSGEQIRALNVLRRHAPQLADESFLNVLAMIRNKPTNISNKVGILAPYVFPDIVNEVGAWLRHAGDADVQVQVSPALIKSFLEFAYDSFTPQPITAQTAENNEFGSASFDRSTMRELIPRFERYLPDKADQFRRHVKDVLASIKKEGRTDVFDNEGEAFAALFRSSVQDWISKAEAAKTQKERDYNYSQAIGVLLYRDGDVEQALVLMNKMSDSEFSKAELLKLIRTGQAQKAIQENDAEKAYHYSKEVQDAGRRANCLMAVARLFAKGRNVERAKAVLAEARQAMDTEPNNMYPILELATVAVEINPAFGFQIMKESVEAINANSRPEGDAYGSGGDEGITFLYRDDFDGNLGVLARTDFDRALELAKSIKPKEASLRARFSVCKGVLAKAELSPEKVHTGNSQ